MGRGALTRRQRRVVSLAALATAAAMAPSPALRAETLSWDADKTPPASGGAGSWNTTDPANTVWFSPSASADVAWNNAGQNGTDVDAALFAGAGGAVSLTEAVTARSVTISPTSGVYAISSGSAAGVITLSGTGADAQRIAMTAASAAATFGAHVTAGDLKLSNTAAQDLTLTGNLTFSSLTGQGTRTTAITAGAASSFSGNVELTGTGKIRIRYTATGAGGDLVAGTGTAGATNFGQLIANAGAGLADFDVQRASGSFVNRVAFAGVTLKSNLSVDPNDANINVGDITVDANGAAGAFTRRLLWWDAANVANTTNGVNISSKVTGPAEATLQIAGVGNYNFTVDNSASMLGVVQFQTDRATNYVIGFNASGAFGARGIFDAATQLDLNVTPTDKDAFEIKSGAFLWGNDAQLGALSRNGGGSAGSVTLASGAIVLHETNAATTIQNMGTAGDVWFGMRNNFTQSIGVGAGAAWRGITTDRDADRSWTTGTITVAGPFELQGLNNRLLTLGNGTNASTLNFTAATTPQTATITGGTVRLNAGGASPTANYSGISQFVVNNTAVLAFGQLNALGGAGLSATPGVSVQSGGNLQWDNVEQTHTGAGFTFAGNYGLRPNATVTYQPALEYPIAATTVTFAGSQLMVLAGGNATGVGATATAGATTINSGAVGISGTEQIGNGNLNVNGGVLVLDGIGWSGFTADRAAIGTGANQWQFNGGGFAARGVPVTITPGAGVGASTFDRNFSLGWHSLVGGSLYANAKTTLDVDTTLTARRVIQIGTAGPGLTGAAGVVHEISGDLSGAGSAIFRSTSTGSDAVVGEVVLSGANTWTGAPTEDFDGGGSTTWTSAGKGGLIVSTGATNPGTNGDLFVRFAGQASLPNGNGGGANVAYLMANRYATGTGTDGRSGYLFTGSDATPAGESYHLNPGYKFVLGGAYNGGTGATLGSTGGTATLEATTVALVRDPNTNATGTLFVRDGTFKLGSTTGANPGPVVFQPANIANNGGTDPGAASPASALSDPTATSLRTLIKRGPGTLEVVDVEYRKLDGTTDASSQFRWDVREGTVLYNDTAANLESSTVAPPTGATNTATLGGNGVFGLAAAKTLTLTGQSATARAVLAPGNSVGTLTVAVAGAGATGGVVFGANSTYLAETADPGDATPSDVLDITGTGGNLSLATATDRLALISTAVGSFTIATYDGTRTGIFDLVSLNGVDEPGTSATAGSVTTWTAASDNLSVVYDATAKTVVANVNVVPEPAAAGLLALGAVGLLGRRRRRGA